MSERRTIRVFLSSTGRDLSTFRGAVHAEMSKLDGYQCIRMEDFGARPGLSKDECLRQVRSCDVFVGIVGHYYGSVVESEGMSYTEMEYEEASDLPRLMFVSPEDFSMPADLREPDWKWDRQKHFREKVLRENTVDRFETGDQLAARVIASLNNLTTSPGITVNAPPGRYHVLVRGPTSAETQTLEISGNLKDEGRGYLMLESDRIRPLKGDRHVLWAMMTPVNEPRPIILDFREGRLPQDSEFERASYGAYKPTPNSDWLLAVNDKPRFEEISEGVKAIVLEPRRTNFLWGDPVAETQRSVHLSAGEYTAWIEGPGEMYIDTGIRVKEGCAKNFSVSESRTVIVSFGGTVRLAQIEEGRFATSYIEAKNCPVTRDEDRLYLPKRFEGKE